MRMYVYYVLSVYAVAAAATKRRVPEDEQQAGKQQAAAAGETGREGRGWQFCTFGGCWRWTRLLPPCLRAGRAAMYVM